jgi:uncharacterized protein YndB with AHSA1/START domain
MKYICLGYIDPNAFAAVPEGVRQAMMDDCCTYDDQLRANGNMIGGEALQPPNTAVTLRYANGKVAVTDGPFAETKEQLGGIMILEARDLNHAVDLISRHPGATFGPWEIRPAADLDEMVRESEARRRAAGTFSGSREIPVPPSAVFAAIQDPTRLARWWGPDGFTNKFDVFEFKPGGKWVFAMIGPDGKVYQNECVFRTIEPARQVVIDHTSAPKFVLTISLEPAAAGTRVGWEQVFEDPKFAQSVRHIIEPATGQNLARLAAEV